MLKINVISSNILWQKYIRNPKLFINQKVKLINKKNTLYKKKILTCSLLLSGTKEIKKLNDELDGFRKTIEDNNSLYESMLDKTTQSLEKIISNTESISKIQ